MSYFGTNILLQETLLDLARIAAGNKNSMVVFIYIHTKPSFQLQFCLYKFEFDETLEYKKF